MSDDENPSAADALKSPLAIAAIAAALVPFFVHISSQSSTTVNGVTQTVFRDYVAIGGGALALLAAILFALTGAGPKAVKAGVAAVVALLGAYHVVHGLGLDRRDTSMGSTEPVAAAAATGCSEATAAPCQAACEGGDGKACDTYGVALDNGTGGLKKDSAAALTWFLKGCDAKYGNACVNGATLAASSRLKLEGGQAQALGLAQKGCELGEAEGCNTAGVALDNGEGVPEDSKAAAVLFKKACDGKFALGCRNLALLKKKGRGVEKDLPAALALYEQACTLGSGGACNTLGVAYDNAEGVEQDSAKAYKLFAKACAAEDGEGCLNQAVLTRNGRGTAKDPAAAVPLLGRGCEAGEERACDEYGVELALGEFVEKDFDGAVKSFVKACEGGSLSGCLNLGISYRDGEGVEKDQDRAIEYFQKVCDAKEEKAEKACALLGIELAEHDFAKAKPLLQAGCKAGFKDACALMKKGGKKAPPKKKK
jgi:TPR repeat protein